MAREPQDGLIPNGTGNTTAGRVDPLEAERLRAIERARQTRLLVASEFGPKRYRGATLDNFETEHEGQAEILAKVRALASCVRELIKAGSSVVWYGTPGTGKDHLMIALLRAAIVQGAFSPQFVAGATLYRCLAPYRFRGSDTDDGNFAFYEEASVLAISDPLPAGCDPSSKDLVNLFELVDARYNARLPTWATMNVESEEEMQDHLTPQIYDRLKEGGYFLPCFWPSYRSARKE
jgi:DNA replication protein DnaC